jgi:hypothetical protein
MVIFSLVLSLEKIQKKGPCSICFVIKSLLMIKKTKKNSVCVHLLWACFFFVRGVRKSVDIGIGVRGWNSTCVKI